MSLATPVILTTLVFMKIIPSVAQILEYDRYKTVTSIIIGSFVPLLMYFTWMVVVLGGGVDITIGLTADVSSSPGNSNDSSNRGKKASSCLLKAALITVTIPLLVILAGLTERENLTLSLKVAGGLGSPLLYGVIPAWMAYNQRSKLGEENNIVPSGMVSISVLGIGASVLIGNEVTQQISAAVASFVVTS